MTKLLMLFTVCNLLSIFSVFAESGCGCIGSKEKCTCSECNCPACDL